MGALIALNCRGMRFYFFVIQQTVITNISVCHRLKSSDHFRICRFTKQMGKTLLRFQITFNRFFTTNLIDMSHNAIFSFKNREDPCLMC